MKKCILILLGLLLLGCARPQAAQAPQTAAAQPAPTAAATAAQATETATQAPAQAADGEYEGIFCLSVGDGIPCKVDLDGDGFVETVDLRPWIGEDEYPRWALVVVRNGQEKRFETDIPCDTAWGVWVGDLDEDGHDEILLHGDLASDDYVIYGFRYDLTPLLFEGDERALRRGGALVSSVFDGRIAGFDDGHIVIEGVVDMLGTHWGVRSFALGDDGVIGPVSTVWTFDDEIEADRPLTLARDITAYKAAVRKDPGAAFTLKRGEKIYLLAGDGCERIWFETEKGKSGVLLLTPDEEHLWRIDGVPEAECFTFLPYSG